MSAATGPGTRELLSKKDLETHFLQKANYRFLLLLKMLSFIYSSIYTPKLGLELRTPRSRVACSSH